MTVSGERDVAAACALLASRLSGGLSEGLPEHTRPGDEAAGYRVQRAVHEMLPLAGHGPRVGWKIGCTTAVMQRYLGIESPCAGGLFQAHVWFSAAEFEIPAGRRLGVECELAVRLATGLPGRGTPTAREAAAAVGGWMLAIEVVEDRYVDYPSLDTPTLIADDFFQRGAVLGPVRALEPNQARRATAAMSIDGQRVGEGTGSDILGDPLEALRWLAGFTRGQGTPLRQGDVVLLGSLVQTQWVSPGQRVECASPLLGGVIAQFSAGDRL